MTSAAFDGVKTSCEMKLSTEYRKRYKQPLISIPKNFKPHEKPIHGDKALDTITTNRKDFVAHKQIPPSLTKPNSICRPEGELDLKSFYNIEYRGVYGEPAKSVKKTEKRVFLQPFNEEPLYRSDFRKWQLPERLTRQKETWSPVADNSDWLTTSRESYRRHQLSPHKNFKPLEQYRRLEAPFDDNSMYRYNYIPHQVSARVPMPKKEYTGCMDHKYIHRDRNCDY